MAENTEHSEQEQSNNFADNLKTVEGLNDDLADYIAKNWKKLVWAVVIAIVAVLLIGKYRDSVLQKERLAAHRFSEARELFTDLKDEVAFNDKLSSLKESYSSTVYADLGTLYLASADIKKAKYADAREKLKEFDIESYKNQTEFQVNRRLNKNILTRELAALVYARSIISEGADLTEAKTILRGLTKTGSFANVEALIVLLRLASSEQERQEVIALAKEITEKRPEFLNQVNQEFTSLGAKLE